MRSSPLLALCASCAVLTAQRSDDQRDVVITTSGKTLHGRVSQRFDPKEITLLQGGKRVRIPAKRVKTITTVVDHIHRVLAHRPLHPYSVLGLRASQVAAAAHWLHGSLEEGILAWRGEERPQRVVHTVLAERVG